MGLLWRCSLILWSIFHTPSLYKSQGRCEHFFLWDRVEKICAWCGVGVRMSMWWGESRSIFVWVRVGRKHFFMGIDAKLFSMRWDVIQILMQSKLIRSYHYSHPFSPEFCYKEGDNCRNFLIGDLLKKKVLRFGIWKTIVCVWVGIIVRKEYLWGSHMKQGWKFLWNEVRWGEIFNGWDGVELGENFLWSWVGWSSVKISMG